MLHSYQAELNGSQLIWIDQPPAPLAHQRVVVVVEALADGAQPAAQRMQGFRTARGCMGRASREQVLAGLNSLREDWTRDPLSGDTHH
jgi:hypothetical protein